MHSITIGANEKEQRIDRFLCKYLNGSSKTNIFKLIRKKIIRVNGSRTKENYKLIEGDIITIQLSDASLAELMPEKKQIPAEELDLHIVYEDDELLIVEKPSGLLTHPDKNEYKKTLATGVQLYLRHLCTRTFRPAPVHRLDKNTSGLVIFAKTYDSLKQINESMRGRGIEKYYETIVQGKIAHAGTIKGWVTKDEKRNKVTLHSKEVPGSLYVHTDYKPLATSADYTLCEVKLHTGRSHQIRVSLASIGHPIAGDYKYGGKKLAGNYSQLLHAWRVVLFGKSYEKRSQEIDRVWKILYKSS